MALKLGAAATGPGGSLWFYWYNGSNSLVPWSSEQVAGYGEKIVCEDNDGWRWEPA